MQVHRRRFDLTVRSLTTMVLLILALTMQATTAYAGGMITLKPAGLISQREDHLLMLTLALMLIVVVPVLVMTAWFAWRYRAGNRRATYSPDWSSARMDAVVWGVPTVIVAILAVVTWTYTHRLSPYSPIDTSVRPLKVQVVALDWKWLFIYPDQGIATVNQLVMPVDRPVNFDITSDTVMNSFFIPQLGGQIYAMAGMRTELHLLADRPGTYFGENTQYSGRGFPYQHFQVLVEPQDNFDAWVSRVKSKQSTLDWAAFQSLEKPSTRDPVRYYAAVEDALFKRIMAKFEAKRPAM